MEAGYQAARRSETGAYINPDYAARKFAKDVRQRARRRTFVLQVPDNKADSVKLRAPCGFKCLSTFWMKTQQE